MIAALVLAAATSFGDLTMRVVGPAVAGGRIAAVAGTAQNDKLYYLGTAGGGVWKSQNGGATWSPVFDQQHVSAIGAVAIDPTNENIISAGTGEANPRNDVTYGDGLYKTTDGAKHWTRVGLEGVWSISRIAIDPKNSNHVVIAAFGDPFKDSTERGVYVTFDGGKTFSKTLYVGPATPAAAILLSIRGIRMLCTRACGSFVANHGPSPAAEPDDGLYKSADGGKTWAKLAGQRSADGIHRAHRPCPCAEQPESCLRANRSQGWHSMAQR